MILLSVFCCACRSGSESARAEAGSKFESEVEAIDDNDSKLGAGEIAPDFSLTDLDGKTVSLSAFRGKPILLNFWATWCAPCIAEMPALARLSKELEKIGVLVVSINVDSAKHLSTVRSFVEKNEIGFPVLLDPKFTVPPPYKVNGFPETMLIDGEGRMVAVLDPGQFNLGQPSKTVKFLGDRPWDSPAYKSAILEALKK